MRKIIKCVLAYMILGIMLISSFQVSAEEEKPEIESEAAILMDFNSGKILFEKDADDKNYPASTTKIMTAILAIENLDYSTVLTASEEAIDIDRDGSNMGILSGEQFTVEALLYGLLVHSANDAANVLAEGVAGNISDFVVMMNQKAQELGMSNTNFVNPHGYHDKDHYMSARDLAALSAYAMKNEKFRAIVATPIHELPPTEKYEEVRNLSSNNLLLNYTKGNKYLYEPARGIKTGHTNDAGFCLSAFAEKDGASYVCVTMKSPLKDGENYSFVDTINLFEYAFENYKMKTISDVDEILATAPIKWSNGDDYVRLTTDSALEILLPADFKEEALQTNISFDKKITAPVKKGEPLGTIEYFYNDSSLGVINLVAKEDVGRSNMKMIFGTIFDIIFSAWVMVPFFILVIILLVIRSYNMKKRRKMREMRRRKNRENF